MSEAIRLLSAGGVPASSDPQTTSVGVLIPGSFGTKSKFWSAAAAPR